MSGDKKIPLIDEERAAIALKATWEISSIATLIGVAVDHLDESDLLAIKGVMKRLTYLNGLIMSVVGDPLETTEELRKRFN